MKTIKKQTKIAAIIIILLALSFGTYYGYERYNLNLKIKASDKIMEASGVKLNDTDRAIVNDILKNNKELEYAYITHTDNTVMLTIMYKKGMQSKDTAAITSKLMNKLKVQYKDKNINVKTMPNS